MSTKTFAQKGIEKTLMLERHKTFDLILAKTEEGPALVIGLEKDDGNFVPLARVLSKVEIDSMDPQFQSREWLNEQLKRARGDIACSDPEEFTDVSALSYLTDEAIPKHFF